MLNHKTLAKFCLGTHYHIRAHTHTCTHTPGSSVGRALPSKRSVVGSSPTQLAAHFSFEKGVVLVGVAMHLPCTP